MHKIINIVLISFFGMMNLTQILASNNDPIELGTVNWIRNLEEGISLAKTENKPLFLLFQEVPGCVTCQRYGQQVLSHPLIAEAIEDLFIPVAIFNNKGGADAKVLKFFGEPAWNNPVVRIVNQEKENVVDRVSGDYTTVAVVQSMIQALQAVNKNIPTYLSLLEQELLGKASGLETTHFSMYCFWTGEKEIGQIDGVVDTQPGFMGGREVVKVQFDPEVIKYKDLLKKTRVAGTANFVFTSGEQQKEVAVKIIGEKAVSKEQKFRPDSEPKYYLSKTHYQYIPMTSLQAVKVNSAIGNSKSPEEFLSPKQKQLSVILRTTEDRSLKPAINKGIIKAWKEVESLF